MDEEKEKPLEGNARDNPLPRPPNPPPPFSWSTVAAELGKLAKTTGPVVRVAAKEKKDEEDQRWWLRYSVAAFVLVTLWAELVGIFFLLLWQGRGGHFKLNDWLIGVVVGGVFIQTMWCLHAIASHLFPEGVEKMKERPKGLSGE